MANFRNVQSTPYIMTVSSIYRGVVTIAVISHVVVCVDLPTRDNIALDTGTQLLQTIQVKAICANFSNNHSFYLQSWQVADQSSGFSFVLQWQTMVTPHKGDGNKEIFQLQEEDYNMFSETSRLGILNRDKPGPVREQFRINGKLTLSREYNFSLTLNSVVTFDDLLMPFVIPIHLCSAINCSDNDECLDAKAFSLITTTEPSVTTQEPSVTTQVLDNPDPQPIVDADDRSWIHEDSYLYGMLAWAVVHSVLILCLLSAIMALYGRVEKLDRQAERLAYNQSQTQSATERHYNPDLPGEAVGNWDPHSSNKAVPDDFDNEDLPGEAVDNWNPNSSNKALQDDFDDQDITNY